MIQGFLCSSPDVVPKQCKRRGPKTRNYGDIEPAADEKGVLQHLLCKDIRSDVKTN